MAINTPTDADLTTMANTLVTAGCGSDSTLLKADLKKLAWLINAMIDKKGWSLTQI